MLEIEQLFLDYVNYLKSVPVKQNKKLARIGMKRTIHTLQQLDQSYRKNLSNWTDEKSALYFNEILLKTLASYYSFKGFWKIIKHNAYSHLTNCLIEQKVNDLKEQYLNLSSIMHFEYFHSNSSGGSGKMKKQLIHFKGTAFFINVPTTIKRQAKAKSKYYLFRYLEKLLQQLNQNNINDPGSYYWRASKTDLVELIYSLHYSKSIGGYATINELVEHFQKQFNTQISNHYKVACDIQSRSSGPNKYLNKLSLIIKNQTELQF